MHVVLIGGTGHVGTALVPRLVELGYSVTVVTRGAHQPYLTHGAWKQVQKVILDRDEEEKAGTFGTKIAALKPDILIDMICFNLESCRHLVEALQGRVQHFLHCSTVWVHGVTTTVPVTEDHPRHPIGNYGICKGAIEAYLHEEAHLQTSSHQPFPATCILPGHIVGQGWVPLNPQANFNPEVYSSLGNGGKVLLPNQGTELLHHVHADDVAQLFIKALTHRNNAVGESFHAVSPAALTLRGYAGAVAGWFGQEARLDFLPAAEWYSTVSEKDADATRGHLEHSPNCYSIAKAQKLLEYHPRYTSLEAIYESLQWLIAQGIIKINQA